MTKKQINLEFKKIKDELINNRPPIYPYSHKIIKKRELLLLAQVCLNNLLFNKNNKSKKFSVTLYNTLMTHYQNA